ncbi:hypothetical protein [Fibrella arboris]|uniref:hypothetical protein n=1 Tax=Fibrella arboris TaxID=3242486 RepID=UPI0035208D56
MTRLIYFTHRLLILTGLVGLLSRCTPAQYARLQPISGPVASLDGRLVTKAGADSVEIVASYEREDMEFLALDIEIKNRTANAIEFNPANMQVTALDAKRQPLTGSGGPSVRQAADPGYEAGRTEYKIKKEERRLKTAKILNTVALVAIVASDIATSSSRSTNRDVQSWASNRVTHDVAYNLIQAKRVIDHGVFADRMQRYQFEGYRWRELALKRSMILPGETVRGFVYIPKMAAATYLNLSYPSPSGTLIELMFEQSFTKAKPQ